MPWIREACPSFLSSSSFFTPSLSHFLKVFASWAFASLSLLSGGWDYQSPMTGAVLFVDKIFLS
jgi:hypothetical protein